MKDTTAWQDWLRVEACIGFGFRRWALAVAAAWWVHTNWGPVAGWLEIAALSVIFFVRHAIAARDDRTRMEKGPNGGGQLVPKRPPNVA
jgi:hypothetical protein